MPESLKKVSARFYRTADGAEPVRDWLLSLDPADRKIVGRDLAVVEFGWPVGMPACRPLGRGLWEVRSDISDSRIARVLFSFAADEIILLHGFIKKSQKTPFHDLALARVRQQEVAR